MEIHGMINHAGIYVVGAKLSVFYTTSKRDKHDCCYSIIDCAIYIRIVE